jgi:hypothetical protein
MRKKYYASVSFFNGWSVFDQFTTKKKAVAFIKAAKKKSSSLASIEMIVDVTDSNSNNHKTVHFIGGV